MAKQQSSSLFTIALLAIGGYFLYENWNTISADLTLPPATAATTSATTYPNSPVPISTPIGADYTDTAGNEWQYNTQTDQWVIVVPAPSAGTVVTAPAPAAAAPAVVPATAGTLVATSPAPAIAPGTVAPLVYAAPVEATLPGQAPATAIPVEQTPTAQPGAPQIRTVILPPSFYRSPWGSMRPVAVAQPIMQANGAPQVAPLTVQ